MQETDGSSASVGEVGYSREARSTGSHCGGGLGLRQLARHAGLGDVRDDGGIEGGGDADEDERAEA